MKHLVFTTIIAALIFVSCNREKEYCWECVAITVDTNQDGSTDTTIMHNYTRCGYTEEEIKGVEFESYLSENSVYLLTCEKE